MNPAPPPSPHPSIVADATDVTNDSIPPASPSLLGDRLTSLTSSSSSSFLSELIDSMIAALSQSDNPAAAIASINSTLAIHEADKRNVLQMVAVKREMIISHAERFQRSLIDRRRKLDSQRRRGEEEIRSLKKKSSQWQTISDRYNNAVSELDNKRCHLLSRVRDGVLSWEISHHFHLIGLCHSLRLSHQPNINEVAILIPGHLRIASYGILTARRQAALQHANESIKREKLALERKLKSVTERLNEASEEIAEIDRLLTAINQRVGGEIERYRKRKAAALKSQENRDKQAIHSTGLDDSIDDTNNNNDDDIKEEKIDEKTDETKTEMNDSLTATDAIDEQVHALDARVKAESIARKPPSRTSTDRRAMLSDGETAYFAFGRRKPAASGVVATPANYSPHQHSHLAVSQLSPFLAQRYIKIKYRYYNSLNLPSSNRSIQQRSASISSPSATPLIVSDQNVESVLNEQSSHSVPIPDNSSSSSSSLSSPPELPKKKSSIGVWFSSLIAPKAVNGVKEIISIEDSKDASADHPSPPIVSRSKNGSVSVNYSKEWRELGRVIASIEALNSSQQLAWEQLELILDRRERVKAELALLDHQQQKIVEKKVDIEQTNGNRSFFSQIANLFSRDNKEKEKIEEKS